MLQMSNSPGLQQVSCCFMCALVCLLVASEGVHNECVLERSQAALGGHGEGHPLCLCSSQSAAFLP